MLFKTVSFGNAIDICKNSIKKSFRLINGLGGFGDAYLELALM
jgi:hypothetical protein